MQNYELPHGCIESSDTRYFYAAESLIKLLHWYVAFMRKEPEVSED